MYCHRTSLAVATICGLAVASSITVAGCGGDSHNSLATSPSNSATTTVVSLHDKSGAQLWSDNCSHCHNLRPPNEFSQREWDIVVHHMRVRATLTGEESRKIVAFLKAAD